MKTRPWPGLLLLFGLMGCGTASNPGSAVTNGDVANALNEKVAALAQAQLQACQAPEFESLRRLSPCKSDEITFAQLANSTKMSPRERALFIQASDRLDGFGKQITALYQASGIEAAQRIGSARAWAQAESTQNRLALVNQQVTWGEYLRQRMSIEAEMLRRAR